MPLVHDHWRLTILVGLLAHLGVVGAVNFTFCIDDVRAGHWGPGGGTDRHGNPAPNISIAPAITYELCTRACGSGAEPFVWNNFSQQFSAWLLPYLALIAQLPFGADDKLDNVLAMLLSVGSPTLAAYSLAITTSNGHWIARRFSRFSYPNVRSAVQILSRLQQTPIKVITRDSLLASLVVLPENDKWWSELAGGLDYTHTWSISSVASIIWVTIAFLFTVINSFTSTITTSGVNSDGQGVGFVYLWLLPVVIGWLQLGPKCDSVRLHEAVERANAEAHVASDRGAIPANDSEGSTDRALSLSKRVSSVHCDEQCSPPIYNYARFLPWVQVVEDVYRVFEQASERAERHVSVDRAIPWEREAKGGKVRPENRRGTLAQVELYVRPPWVVPRSHWGPDVLSRFLVASFLALALTWSTTGAAIIAVWFTPTIGLGCRSGAYILYGAVSTFVWMILVTSSALAHYSTQSIDVRGETVYTRSTRIAGKISIILRRLGKVVATCNAVWIVLACIFQFSSFFDCCYCNSSKLGLGSFAYYVIDLVSADLATMKTAWIGAVALAGGCSILFVVWVNIFINPPLPPE
ncbi:hypothetical protein FB451DRAFT_1225190 [Mycena latifolia]|nr:hypothetical protein FB451DRAFT_1225190 [Mycena latifolia]